MKLLTRYLAREIYTSTALVFSGLLMLFSFFDLVHELSTMGHGNYNLGYVLLYVLLTVPSHIYDLFPVAILIGTIFGLVQMAANSELIIFRSSGASLRQMIWALVKIGLPLVLLSYFCGEMLAPSSERMAQALRLKAQNLEVSLKEFRTGVWVKDGKSFVNVKDVLPDTTLLNINIYEFDDNAHLASITSAKSAAYQEKQRWQMQDVTKTVFAPQSVKVLSLPTQDWHSSLNPDMLSVLLVVPEEMSAWTLYQYARHLRENHQKSARYEIAMWTKLVYPFAVLVMMMLALPFAAYHRREGGISGKIFMGILLGLSFHFLGRLFASLGALNDWQPLLSATVMPAAFLMLALGMLWWTERR